MKHLLQCCSKSYHPLTQSVTTHNLICVALRLNATHSGQHHRKH